MRPKLPTDSTKPTITDKYVLDTLEKQHKDRLDAQRYRVPLIVSILALLVAVISLILQIRP